MNFFTKLLQRFRVFRKKTRKKAVYFYGMAFLVLPGAAFAYGDSGFWLLNMLQDLLTLLSTKIVQVVFCLGIVGVGYNWLWTHKIPKEKAIGTMCGIGLILSAPYLARKFGIMS